MRILTLAAGLGLALSFAVPALAQTESPVRPGCPVTKAHNVDGEGGGPRQHASGEGTGPRQNAEGEGGGPRQQVAAAPCP